MQNFKPNPIIEVHTVGPLDQKMRLQDYGALHLESIPTKSSLKKIIKKGLIRLDGRLAQTSDWIEEGQVLKVFADQVQKEKKVFELNLEVIFEDDFFAVILKPSGFPTNGNYFKTIENALPFNLKASSAKDALPYPQPVHRLDNPTSGILLVAKTRSFKTHLSLLFEHHKVQKKYMAITEGDLPKEGKISTPVDGKESLTTYTTEAIVIKGEQVFSRVELTPETGRTHQLRIHLSSLGHPIVGDADYGSAFTREKLMLHAISIQFKHPVTKKSLTFETPFPHKFVKFIDA